MSTLTAEQRGDMVEALLPEAAGLVVDVHEGSAEDIKTRLSGLSRHELEALAVLLAALADPDRGLVDALSWVDFDEHGEPLGPRAWKSSQNLRDQAADVPRELAGMDVVAVHRALSADNRDGVSLKKEERRLAIEVGLRRGLSYELVADRLGMQPDAVKRSWERIKKRAREAGEPVPQRPLVAVPDAFRQNQLMRDEMRRAV